MGRDWLLPFVRLCNKRNSAPGLLVLTFHRTGGPRGLSAQRVAHHLELLSFSHHVVAPRQLPLAPRAKNLAWITIDDGHADAYNVLFPIAKELGLPFTIFPPTDFLLRGKWLWFDRVNYAVAHAAPNRVWEHHGRRYPINERSRRSILKVLKQMQPDQCEAAIQRIAHAGACRLPQNPPPEYSPLSMEQLSEMLSSGLVTLGAHTVSHTIATVLPPSEFQAELRQCKRELEELAGERITTFCYPNGLEGDINIHTRQLVQEAGFSWALSSLPGVNRWAALDPGCVRRVHANQRISVLEKEIASVSEPRLAWLRGRNPANRSIRMAAES